MKAVVPNGKYILAVSGGIDSMVLLHMLSKMPGLELVVAHFNHGIRPESKDDEELVVVTANQMGLVCEVGIGHLGAGSSEERARKARYDFLNHQLAKHAAAKIITAHHQDDWLETVFINLYRGTGLKGLSPMMGNKVLRPLLKEESKKTILEYAKRNKIQWNEDKTNLSKDYLRNYLRLIVLPRLSRAERNSLISNLEKVANINQQLENEFAKHSHRQIERQTFSNLPSKVGNEYMAYILRQIGVKDYNSDTISRLSMAVKTAKPNSSHSVKLNTKLSVSENYVAFLTP